MKNKKYDIIFITVVSITFIIAMFLMSKYTSPLYPYDFGYDSAIFSLIGKSIVNGKIPYTDLFDHKGPLLFFIEALGYYLNGHTGILLIQCLFGIINLIFIYKIWKIIKDKDKDKKTSLLDLIFILTAGFSIFFYTFEGGNLTEEYSLPFISCALYLFIKYALNTTNESKHPYSYSFIYGILLMSLTLIRINNAITIFSGILSIVIYLLYKKEYKNLLLNILSGILGCLLVFLPFMIYFSIHNALYDMIYGTFIYNFKYAGNIGHSSILNNLQKYLILYIPMILSLIIIFINKRNEQKITNKKFLDFLLIVIVFFNIVSLIIVNTYPHYFTVYIPVFVTILIKYWQLSLKSLKTIFLVILICLYSYNVLNTLKSSLYYHYKDNHLFQKYTIINNDLSLIPKEEKSSIIGYNIPSAYYLMGDIIPCYKYYTHQEWWSISNPNIQEEFTEWLSEENPLWVITLKDEDNQKIINILSQNYQLKYSNDYLNIYNYIVS